MTCMRSTQGTFLVDIPESALTTVELDANELRTLVGEALALDYMRHHEVIDVWRRFAPGVDTQNRIVPGGWTCRPGWRVQYKIGWYARAHHIVPSSAPSTVPTAEPTVTEYQ